MRVLITGGGTGGHIYPALAIARGLQNKYDNVELLYVGTKKGLEADIVPKEGIAFKTVEVEGLQRKISLQIFSTGLKVTKGFLQAKKIVQDFNPDIVIGTGGYVCGPVVLAAALQKKPTLIHEQNAYPGITNKVLARFVDKIVVTFPESVKYFPNKPKITVAGLPIRPEILQAEKEEGYKKLNLSSSKKTILVVGGSRGARTLNIAMVKALATLKDQQDLQVIHVAGQVGFQETMERAKSLGIPVDNSGNITIIPYLYDMAHALRVTDLIVCRAGATTIAELTALGLPSILVPYPYASENHQEHNARALENQGAAILIKDSDLSAEILLKTILKVLEGDNLTSMAKNSKAIGKPQALESILNTIDQVLDKYNSQF